MRLDTIWNSGQAAGEQVLNKLFDAKMIILVEPGEEWRGLPSFMGNNCRSVYAFPGTGTTNKAKLKIKRKSKNYSQPPAELAVTAELMRRDMSGETALAAASPPDHIKRLLKKMSVKYSLTSRETEVISQLCEGCRDFSEIASRMDISPKTLRNHMSSIYLKTKTPSILALYSLLIHYLINNKGSLNPASSINQS
ncbi:helix-turn-helix transcriptional regulator [Paenibacillus senegalensis]|uniref:helix-turn-helix transcriptional regulator n=1 Tax=Paenibacillus senegalensis TaxID=1465766 RepID=UPI0002889CAD|nr:helix-turn-helix transcriptional regulator [Paenibacillus senegalensis]